ncbi:uncharacterized protein LOC141857651 [Brevipalpus obovatus]|uniref:uncharacterized protein LOC141857651 n=1 Tax=Brevipalpus obovatus TaxID=246614 RepID=UPI003D9EC149
MDSIGMMDGEIQMEMDFSVVEEIELDEHGDEVNRAMASEDHHQSFPSNGDESPTIQEEQASEDFFLTDVNNHVELCSTNDYSDEVTVSTDNVNNYDGSLVVGRMDSKPNGGSNLKQFNHPVDNRQSQSHSSSADSSQSRVKFKISSNKKNEIVSKPSNSESLLSKSPTASPPTTRKSTKQSMNNENNAESLLKTDTCKNDQAISKPSPDLIAGLKVKQFTALEMEAFRKPFEMGWGRELVLRGTTTSTGKKIGDVYYFSPDHNVKLRSYIEMGHFLRKHTDCGLEPENFTFARQPIFKPPHEIVRHAAPRSRSESIEEKSLDTNSTKREKRAATQKKPIKPETEEIQNTEIQVNKINTSKRKRNAPSRFEDEDHYEQSPFKKKAKTEKPTDSGSKSHSKLANGTAKSNQNSSISNQNEISKKAEEKMAKDIKCIDNSSLVTKVNEDNFQKPASPLPANQPELPPKVFETTSKPTQPPPSLPKEQPESSVTSEMNGVSHEENTSQTPDIVPDQTSPLSSEKKDKPDASETDKSQGESTVPVDSLSPSEKINKKPKVSEPLKPEKRKRKSKAERKAEKMELEKLEKSARGDKVDISMPEDVMPLISLATPAPCSILCNGKKGLLPNLLCDRCLCLFHPECVPSGIYIENSQGFICPNCIQPADIDPANMALSSIHMNGGFSDLDLPLDTRTSRPSSLKGSCLSGPPVKSKTPAQFFDNGYPFPPDNRYSSNTRLLYNNRLPDLGDQFIPNHKSKYNRHFIENHPRPSPPFAHHPPPGYRPLPIAPIAPIKYSLNQVAEIIQELENKQREKIGFVKPEITQLTNGYECLIHVFKYLTVRELVKLKQVSRIFNVFASQPSLWNIIKLRGLVIKDWSHLGSKIIEERCVQELDFEGIRCPNGSSLTDMWLGFADITDYLKSVKVLRFGTVPSFVLQEIVNALSTDNPYNSYSNLETLEVKNLCDDDSSVKTCSFTLLDQLSALPSLQSLQLDSKCGMRLSPEMNIDTLTHTFSKLTNLKSLALTTLRNFNSEQFSFLSHLTNLENLEIGSCESWTHDEPTESTQSKPEAISEPAIDHPSDCHQDVQKQNTNPLELPLTGGFKYLSGLTRLKKLKLCDVIIDESCANLPTSLKEMKDLRHLCLHNLTISPDASQTLDLLCNVIKNSLVNLKSLTVCTTNPYSNKYVFELLKKLYGTLYHMRWEVPVIVEDSGECFVPFLKERGGESDMEIDNIDLLNGTDNLDMMDFEYLNQLIRSQPSSTKSHVEIIPQ